MLNSLAHTLATRRTSLVIGSLCLPLAFAVGFVLTNHVAAAPGSGFVVPLGSGQGQIAYVTDGTDPWGPMSFCLLPDKSIAILDAGNHRIQVFSSNGSFVYAVNLAGVAVSPVDLRWWRGCFAILEASSDPNSLILLTPKGEVKQTVELPPNLAAMSSGGMRIGSKGELELLEAGTWPHVLMDNQGAAVDKSAMSARQETIALQGGPEFTLSQDGSGARNLKLMSAGLSATVKPNGLCGGVTPLAADASGASYFVSDSVYQSSPDQPIAVDRVVVKMDKNFRQQALARLDLTGSVVTSARMLDVADDGTVYSMVGKADGVHFQRLGLSATIPAFTAAAPIAASVIASNPDGSVSPMVGTPGWTRSNGYYQTQAYYNLNWYCSQGAYDRSNQYLSGDQATDNIKPRFLTSYSRYWQWTPYCWGGWDTTSFFTSTVNATSPGRDAGDIGPSYSNCAMNDYGNLTNYPCCGVDCSGFVGRCWGLNDVKRNVAQLEGLSTQIAVNFIIQGDAFAHTTNGTHIMWFNSFQGQGYNIMESTTWNSYDSVRNTYHDMAYVNGWGVYRYNYWY
jgi:hypothetical protein